jgi:hypothetical protein
VARCELTELEAASCAHCRNLLSPQEQVRAHRAALLAAGHGWFASAYPGVCGHCGEPFDAGTAIRLLNISGDGAAQRATYLAECCATTPRSVR